MQTLLKLPLKRSGGDGLLRATSQAVVPGLKKAVPSSLPTIYNYNAKLNCRLLPSPIYASDVVMGKFLDKVSFVLPVFVLTSTKLSNSQCVLPPGESGFDSIHRASELRILGTNKGTTQSTPALGRDGVRLPSWRLGRVDYKMSLT